jgi:protein tyrosine/serine phosphatase
MNFPRFLRRLFGPPIDGFRHFAVVDEGVLYRCGQPSPEQLAELLTRYKIATVVSFRGSRDPNDPDAWERAERDVCATHGATFVSIPCNHKNPPTAAQAEQFINIIRDPGRHPVLVHCRLGQQRTMLFVALYWIHIKGWDPATAERAMDEAGFNIRHRRHQRLLESFRALAAMPAGA